MNPMTRMFGVAATVIVFCLGALSFADFWLYSSRPFAQDVWQKGDERQRARMVYDLKNSGTLLGKTRPEIEELLGQPDSERARAICYHFVRGSIIGDALKLPFSDWMEWLGIAFDSEGRVSRVNTND